MITKTPMRWQQRFQSFKKVFLQLKKAVRKTHYTALEQAGITQMFNFTFELAWKTLKNLLETKGYTLDSPRTTIKQAFQSGYIKDADIWLDALEKRNIMARVYDDTQSRKIIALIKKTYFPLLAELHDALQKHAKNT